jgi:hypothetical protein
MFIKRLHKKNPGINRPGFFCFILSLKQQGIISVPRISFNDPVNFYIVFKIEQFVIGKLHFGKQIYAVVGVQF